MQRLVEKLSTKALSWVGDRVQVFLQMGGEQTR